MSSALDELRLLKDHLDQIINNIAGSETTVVRPPVSDEANTEPQMQANKTPQGQS